MAVNLNVEFSPGTSLTDAAQELADSAKRLDATLWAKFNGDTMIAHPGEDWACVLDRYWEWKGQKSNRASVRPSWKPSPWRCVREPAPAGTAGAPR